MCFLAVEPKCGLLIFFIFNPVFLHPCLLASSLLPHCLPLMFDSGLTLNNESLCHFNQQTSDDRVQLLVMFATCAI